MSKKESKNLFFDFDNLFFLSCLIKKLLALKINKFIIKFPFN